MVSSLIEKPVGAIMFTNDDFPLEEKNHSRALFIWANIKGKMTCCIMVDGGSAINIYPLKLMPKLDLTTVAVQAPRYVLSTQLQSMLITGTIRMRGSCS